MSKKWLVVVIIIVILGVAIFFVKSLMDYQQDKKLFASNLWAMKCTTSCPGIIVNESDSITGENRSYFKINDNCLKACISMRNSMSNGIAIYKTEKYKKLHNIWEQQVVSSCPLSPLDNKLAERTECVSNVLNNYKDIIDLSDFKLPPYT